MPQKPARTWSLEEKISIIKDIDSFKVKKEGLKKYNLRHSVYYRWKKNLKNNYEMKPTKTIEKRSIEAAVKKVIELKKQVEELKDKNTSLRFNLLSLSNSLVGFIQDSIDNESDDLNA